MPDTVNPASAQASSTENAAAAEARPDQPVTKNDLADIKKWFAEGLDNQTKDLKESMVTKADFESLRRDVDREMGRLSERMQILEIRSMAGAQAQAFGATGLGAGYSFGLTSTIAPRDSLRRRRGFL